MVKIGIIGLGEIGLVHLRGFNVQRDCRVTAVCDISERMIERARKLPGGAGARVFRDYRELLGEADVDAVVVGLPVHLHTGVASAALDAGKDVFVEKPIAPTMDDCDDFILKAFRTDRVVQVGLVYRYSNLYRTMGRMVEDGKFGNVMMMYCKEYRDNFPEPWFFDRKLSGGAIMDKNCHHFDLFNWYIRSRPVRVYAMGGQHVVKGERVPIRCSYSISSEGFVSNPSIVDHAFVLVEYENGAKGNLGLCMYEIEPVEGLEIGLMGDNGAHALAKRDISLIAGGGPLGDISEMPVDYYTDGRDIGHIGCIVEQAEFLECVRTRRMPYSNLFIARDCMVVCAAAELSIERKREVLISEFDNPEVEKVRRRLADRLYSPTPPPLPPPDEKKKLPAPLENAYSFLDLLLRLLFQKTTPASAGLMFVRFMMRGTPGSPRVERSVRALNALAGLVNLDPKFRRTAANIATRLSLKLPGAAPLTLEISRGRLSVHPPGAGEPPLTIRITERGLKELLDGEAPRALFFRKLITFDGDTSSIKGFTETLSELADAGGKKKM
ncbi:MAG: Gfo/Idh/MocA family oxidoreductase [bacterium]